MDDLESLLDVLERLFDEQETRSEHEVIQAFKQSGKEPFTAFDLKHSQDLFQAHFLAKHLLYRLQDKYSCHGIYRLDISLTRITRLNLFSGNGNLNQTSLELGDPCKEYYLDLKHYFETTEDEVVNLLAGFWKRFLASEDKLKALDTLGLDAQAEYADVKRQYRKLAQRYHPDKGGSAAKFNDICSAKKLLDVCFSVAAQ